MRKKRKNIIVIALLLICVIGIGFAYLSTNLTINGTASVSATTWDVHFENVQVDSGSVTGSQVVTEPTLSTNTNTSFEVSLNNPGEYYKFTIDVVNIGSIDAMIDSVNTGSLTDEQKKYLEYSVTYDDGEEIKAKDLLENTTGKETLLVSIKYKDDLEASDLPSSADSLTFNISLTYVQADDSAIARVTKAKILNLKVPVVGNSSDIDFNVSSQYAEENNGAVAGLYKLDSEGIYFYRGSVTNNNVLFANYCWKIVRTTSTGGLKLIYNGTPTDGQCTNTTGSSTYVGTSKFNTSYDDAKYVGYTYDDGTGKQTDSTIKTYIDNWYNTNMTSYTSYLEDTDYCNDRSVVSSTDAAYSNIYSPTSSYTYFGTYARASYRSIDVKPTTVCPQSSDKYTVSSSNGNGLLTYPVGLLTSDEMALAGATSYYNASGSKNSSLYTNSTYYLYNNYYYWGLSPSYFYSSDAGVGFVNYSSSLGSYSVYGAGGVRPVVSLDSEAQFESSGDGTSTNPYVVSSK